MWYLAATGHFHQIFTMIWLLTCGYDSTRDVHVFQNPGYPGLIALKTRYFKLLEMFYALYARKTKTRRPKNTIHFLPWTHCTLCAASGAPWSRVFWKTRISSDFGCQKPETRVCKLPSLSMTYPMANFPAQFDVAEQLSTPEGARRTTKTIDTELLIFGPYQSSSRCRPLFSSPLILCWEISSHISLSYSSVVLWSDESGIKIHPMWSPRE